MNGRNLLIWGLVFVFFIIALQRFEFSKPGPQAERLSYSEFVAKIGSSDIKVAEIDKGNVKGVLSDGKANVGVVDDDAAQAEAENDVRSHHSPVVSPSSNGLVARSARGGEMGAMCQQPATQGLKPDSHTSRPPFEQAAWQATMHEFGRAESMVCWRRLA